MVNLKELMMKGFRSHIDSHIQFDKLPNETLVLGNIRANPGVDSNGAGKSSIFYATSWALFGKWISRVRADDVINFDSDEASVKLSFDVDGTNFYIKRIRGKKNDLILFNEELGDISGNTTTQTQEAILDLLKIDPKTDYISDFHNAVMFSTDSIRNFAGPGMTNEERMATLARFLKADKLDLAKKRAADLRKELTYEQTNLLSQVTVIQEEMNNNTVAAEESETLEAQLKSTQTILKEAEEIEIKVVKARELFSRSKSLESSLQNQQANLKRVKTNIEAEIERYREKIRQAQQSQEIINKTGDLSMEGFEITLNDIDIAEKELGIWMQKIRSEIGILNKEVTFYQEQLKGSQKCPGCGIDLAIVNNKIIITDTKIIEEQREERMIELTERETLLKESKKDQSDLSTSKLETISRMKEIDEKIKKVQRLKIEVEQIPELQKEINRFMKQIESEEKAFNDSINKTKVMVVEIETELKAIGDLNELEKQYKMFEDSPIENRRALVESLKERSIKFKLKKENLSRLKHKLIVVNEKLKELKPQIDVNRFWETGFPVVRRWIIESQLPLMEETINSSLLRLGMNFSLTMKTMRAKKKGDDEYPDFNLEIVDSYGHSKPIETLSGGEERRIAIAVALALIEQASRSDYMSFNILMMDEVIDTLDSSGVDEFFKILGSIPQKKLIISHSDKFKDMFDRVIIVNNQNGKSWIEVN